MYTLIEYKGQHSRKKPRIRMLTSCTWWSKGAEYNIQYETESDSGRELYFNDESGGVTYVNTSAIGKDFWFVRDAKPEFRESLKAVKE